MANLPNSDNNERDPRLAALYRSASVEEPSGAVDDAIRAAARRAVAAGPRHVDARFKRSWAVPLSLAAVLVLSVSLVTVMREQAPEVLQPQTGLPSATITDKPNSRADTTSSVREEVPRNLSGKERSSSIGLKPSSPGSGQGLRRDQENVGSISSYKQERPADRLQTEPFAGATLPRAFPGAVENKTARAEAPNEADSMREKQGVLSAQQVPSAPKVTSKPEADARAAANEGARARDAAAPPPQPAPAASAPAADAASRDSIDSKLYKNPAPGISADKETATPMRQAAPQAKVPPLAEAVPAAPPPAAVPAPSPPPAKIAGSPSAAMQAPSPPPAKPAPKPAVPPLAADVNQAPAKWLDQIIELRKQGRLDEARASFGEFRKRYPDYPLPPALKDWGQP